MEFVFVLLFHFSHPFTIDICSGHFFSKISSLSSLPTIFLCLFCNIGVVSLPYSCSLCSCYRVYHIVQPITSFGHSSRKCPLSIGFLNTSNFHHRAQFASCCCNCRESNLSSSIDLYHSSFHYSIHLVYSPPRFLSFFLILFH